MTPYQFPSWPAPAEEEPTPAEVLEMASVAFGGEQGRVHPSPTHPSPTCLAHGIAVIHAITSTGEKERSTNGNAVFDASNNSVLLATKGIGLDFRSVKQHADTLGLVTRSKDTWTLQSGIDSGQRRNGDVQDFSQYFRLLVTYVLQLIDAKDRHPNDPVSALRLPMVPPNEQELFQLAECDPRAFHPAFVRVAETLRHQDTAYALAAIMAGETSWKAVVQRYCDEAGGTLPHKDPTLKTARGRLTSTLGKADSALVAFGGNDVSPTSTALQTLRKIVQHAAALALGCQGSDLYPALIQEQAHPAPRKPAKRAKKSAVSVASGGESAAARAYEPLRKLTKKFPPGFIEWLIRDTARCDKMLLECQETRSATSRDPFTVNTDQLELKARQYLGEWQQQRELQTKTQQIDFPLSRNGKTPISCTLTAADFVSCVSCNWAQIVAFVEGNLNRVMEIYKTARGIDCPAEEWRGNLFPTRQRRYLVEALIRECTKDDGKKLSPTPLYLRPGNQTSAKQKRIQESLQKLGDEVASEPDGNCDMEKFLRTSRQG